MTDTVAEPPLEIVPAAKSLDQHLVDLERRVQALENRVATFPDATRIEEHVTERIQASLPPPPPPVEPARNPSLQDIALPIPSIQSVVDSARTTWTMLEIFGEIKLMFWMLVDRRYRMSWLARVIVIALVVEILLSHLLIPLARIDTVISPIWDKLVNLFVGLLLFTFLHFELRRYKEWRSRG